MSADPIQTKASTFIKANVALAAFGDPLLYDVHADVEAYKTTASGRIDTAGVCIEVGPVIAPAPADTIGGVLTPPVGEFSIYAAEKIGGAHTPKGPELWRAILGAMHRSGDFSFTGYDSLTHEHGYVLHVLSFTHPIFAT